MCTLKYHPILLAFMLTGCAPSGLYDWGRYENSLYQRYIEYDSELAEIYVKQSLDEAISSNRVPPGLYADYGFILYQRGNKNAAIELFEKEKKLFPESSALMSTLIKRVKQQTVQTTPNLSISNGVNP